MKICFFDILLILILGIVLLGFLWFVGLAMIEYVIKEFQRKYKGKKDGE